MQKHPTSQAATSSRPFLKWVGGKSRILQHVIPRLPRGRRLFEPFVGGGAVFLGVEFEAYLLNDSNTHLIELYRAVTERPTEFMNMASSLFVEHNRSSGRYAELRTQFNNEPDSLTRAALFLYLNRHGFNGLCRYNKRGNLNVPYGHPVRLPRFPREEILNFVEKARKATFVNDDFAAVMRRAVPGDVVYCDPPYADPDGARSFTAYGPAGFGMDRQQELAELARELRGAGVPVVISNHDCSAARELYAGAKIFTFAARRSISADGTRRGDVGELLAVFEA
ncbi:Dam family site-specific DNA-(adenine-N6)-methyltransferase [Paraburkholderia fungorum]|uniref:DNA adenine methylase n=1 Tax=Paraburkholderia fungorum TaxID=134537 RepID=UPI0038BA42B8